MTCYDSSDSELIIEATPTTVLVGTAGTTPLGHALTTELQARLGMAELDLAVHQTEGHQQHWRQSTSHMLLYLSLSIYIYIYICI